MPIIIYNSTAKANLPRALLCFKSHRRIGKLYNKKLVIDIMASFFIYQSTIRAGERDRQSLQILCKSRQNILNF